MSLRKNLPAAIIHSKHYTIGSTSFARRSICSSSSRESLILGVLLAAGPEDVRARLAPKHKYWPATPMKSEGEKRQQYSHDNATQCAQEQHTNQRGHGPTKLHQAVLEDYGELRQLDHARTWYDHDHRQCCLWHQAYNRCQEKQNAYHHSGRHKARDLAAGTSPAVDGGLRRATAGGLVVETTPDQVCEANCDQLLVGFRPRFERLAECLTRGNRFDKAHQGNAQGGGPELLKKRKVRQGEGRQPAVHFSFRPVLEEEDVGIDAHIELCGHADEPTGVVVALQVKSGESYIHAETRGTFVFHSTEPDLDYWQSFALPVYSVVFRPAKKPAYWLDVKEACAGRRFEDMLAGVTPRKLVFQKANVFAKNFFSHVLRAFNTGAQRLYSDFLARAFSVDLDPSEPALPVHIYDLISILDSKTADTLLDYVVSGREECAARMTANKADNRHAIDGYLDQVTHALRARVFESEGTGSVLMAFEDAAAERTCCFRQGPAGGSPEC